MASAGKLTSIAAFILFFLGCAPVSAQGGQYQVDGREATEQEYRASQLIVQGLNLLHQNQNAQAADLFAQAVQLGPNLATAHVDYGIALSKLNKNDLAVAELKQAVQLDPNQPSAWLTLGGLYQTQGQIDQAIGALSEFTTRFPTHPDAAKVGSLIQGLAKLSRTLPRTSPAQSVSAGQPAMAADDYYPEATPQGVHRWPASMMPIKVFVRPGTNVPFYKPEYDDILKRAFSDWMAASQNRVQFQFVSRPEAANIECSWIADPGSLANAAEAGETRLALNSTGIVHATVMLLTVPLVAALPITDNRLRVICLHEIGHVIGFTGHTRNPDDIMFFSNRISDDWRELSARDKNTLIRLYSEPSR